MGSLDALHARDGALAAGAARYGCPETGNQVAQGVSGVIQRRPAAKMLVPELMRAVRQGLQSLGEDRLPVRSHSLRVEVRSMAARTEGNVHHLVCDVE